VHDKDFVVQFGIASESTETNKWDDYSIPDDIPTIPPQQSNVQGTITYATSGPNTRTTQLFVNINDNTFLDNQGFTPFGKVIAGMEVLQHLIYNPTPGSSDGVDQSTYQEKGNDWILQHYPEIDIITSTELIESEG
jgi:peptidyl-prolyl cis-trans isomerase A (cyclophilin A)